MLPSNNFKIRRLTEDDVEAYREIRLEMLKLSPEAFGEAYEDAVNKNLDLYKERLIKSAVFGAFDKQNLCATAGFFIQDGSKSAHKAFLWGVYVQSKYRGNGLSHLLVEQVITNLPSTVEIIQTGVVQNNVSAIKTYKKAGFKKWGLEEKALKMNNQYYDEIHMVKILKNDK